MPPRTSPTVAIRYGSKRSALLAMVLAGLAASLFAISVPKAAGGSDQVAPSAPTNLRVTGASQTAVTVEWAKSTDNVGVEGYRVTFSWSKYKTPETQFTATGLACGVSYPVGVRAYDHVRNVSPTASAIVSTAPCLDMQAPTAPSDLQQIASGPTTATLSWSAATDNVAVAGYAVSQGGVEVETTTETSWVFSWLACSRTYPVAVRAFDVAGNSSSWVGFYVTTSSCGDVSAPTAPTGLTQTDRTESTMALAWSASTDNVGVASYAVFRNGSELGSTTGRSYALTALTCGASHIVGVEAVDGAGNRSQRTTAAMSTASCSQPPPGSGDTQPPSAPSNLTVGSATTSAIALSWSPSTDNVGVAGYDVFRDGVRIGVVTATSYSYTGLSCGQTYQLGVEANDAAGNHSSLASVVASTSPCADSSPPSPPGNLVLLSRTGTSVTVNWAASSDNVGVAGYGAYVDGTFGGSTGSTTYTLTGLACGTSRTFGIDAYDAAGNRSSRINVVLQTAACGDALPPSTPTQLAVSGTTQTSVTLSWAASSDNVAVAGYDVYVNASKVATVTGTSSAIGNLTCNTAYTLGVEAFDAVGNRSSRGTVSVTTAACSAPPPPPSLPGNLFVSPTGNDAGSCTQVAPCRSVDRAYSVAALGDTVLMASGDYGPQLVTDKPGKDTTGDAPNVVFEPAPGATVRFSDLCLGSGVNSGDGPDHLTIRNVADHNLSGSCGGLPADIFIGGDDANDILIENYDSGAFYINGAQNVTIKGGDWGPCLDYDEFADDCTNSKVDGNPANMNIVLDGITLHDYTFGPNCSAYGGPVDCHNEGLFLAATGPGFVLRNSRFWHNEIYNVFIQPNGAASMTIENNWFGRAENPPSTLRNGALVIGGCVSSLLVRFNSFAPGQGLVDEGGGCLSNVRGVGNIFGVSASDSCLGGVAYSSNVWTSGSCGTNSRAISPLPYINASDLAAMNYRLVPGSAAENLVSQAGADYALETDIDRESRSAPRDAGSDEVG